MERRPGRRRGITAVVLLLLGSALIAGPTAFSLSRFTAVHVVSESMRPTLVDGDLLVMQKDPAVVHRGEIVLYDPADWGMPDLLIGRVVAVEGDRISYRKGDAAVALNGQPLEEPYVLEAAPGAGGVDFDVTVPRGRVFVLGDNRGNSADSRFHSERDGGTLPESAVVGVEFDQERPLALVIGLSVFAGMCLLPVGAGLGIAALVVRRRHRPVPPVHQVWGSARVE
uniref:Signal peptidase I n=1 Tax=Streptomyces sp. NBC_00049 TaxID=2903617 RepID=A0AAU2JPK0_9ACTN